MITVASWALKATASACSTVQLQTLVGMMPSVTTVTQLGLLPGKLPRDWRVLLRSPLLLFLCSIATLMKPKESWSAKWLRLGK